MIAASDDRPDADATPPTEQRDIPAAGDHPEQPPPTETPAGGEAAEPAGVTERPRRRRRRRRRPAKPPEGAAAPPQAGSAEDAAAAPPGGDGQMRERLTIRRPQPAAAPEGTPANRAPRPRGRGRRRPGGRPSGAETAPRDARPGTEAAPREPQPGAEAPPRDGRRDAERPPGQQRRGAARPRQERATEPGAGGRGERGKPRRGRGPPGPKGDRGLPPKRPERVLISFESVVDRGFEDVADEANDGATRRVTWAILKRTVADQRTTRPVSAVYVLQREGIDAEFANLGAARAAAHKTIVHPEKLTRAKAEYAATKKK